MIETDFRRFYGADLRDFWRSGSGMTYRWVVSHIRHLPEDSWYVKHIRHESGQIWDQQDHHRQDMVDLLQQAVYFLSVEAGKNLKDSQRGHLHRNAPKPAIRPGQEQEKARMSSKQELRDFFGGGR